MSIPGFGGSCRAGRGAANHRQPQRGVLRSVQAGRKVASRWRDVSGVTHPGGVALAMLANLQQRGGYRGRVEEALLTRYDLPEQAAGFFWFFAQAGGLRRQGEMTCP